MRLTIGKKLSFGFGVVILLIVVTAAVAYVNIATMNDSVGEVVDEAFPTIGACNRLSGGVTDSIAALRGYLILGANPAQAKLFKAHRTDTWREIDAATKELERFSTQWVDSQQRQHMDQLALLLSDLRAAQQKVEEIGHTKENVLAYHMLLTKGVPLNNQILESLGTLIDEETAQDASAERKQLMKAMADSRASFTEAMADVRMFLITSEEEFQQAFEDAWTTNERGYDSLKQSQQLYSPSQRAQFDRYSQLRDSFGPLAQQLIELRGRDDWNQANYLLAEQAMPRATKVKSLLGSISTASRQRKDEKMRELDTASRTLNVTLIVATIVAVSIGVLVAAFLSRQIITLSRRLADRVQQISRGDLTGEALVVKSADELGELARGFDGMLGNLRDLTTQIHSVTENVNSAATQISASTRQQAASTKEQAATVQEITSTMQELSQSGAQIVEKAREVASSAEGTASSSKAGIEAVQRTNSAMHAIREQVEEVAENIVALSEKTQAVGEIIATVTDVAEQSNLLALNATIEAAEAGDEGNRFSVVASEMKNLADQAKQCTVQVRTILSDIQKGINTAVMLTEEAVKRVEIGKQQADLSEQSIREMSDTTEQSVQAFQQIIAATNQQQVGFEQVTRGMKDIDQATQQTASGTAQLEQAVVSLSSLSKQLKTAVGSYRV